METLPGILMIDGMGKSAINGISLALQNGLPDKFSAATNFVVSQGCSHGNPATASGRIDISGTETVFFVVAARPGIITPVTHELNLAFESESANKIKVKKEKKKKTQPKSSGKAVNKNKKNKKTGGVPEKSKPQKNNKD